MAKVLRHSGTAAAAAAAVMVTVSRRLSSRGNRLTEYMMFPFAVGNAPHTPLWAPATLIYFLHFLPQPRRERVSDFSSYAQKKKK